jgi:hypothetical protein
VSPACIRWLACGLAILAELTLSASALTADPHKQVLTLYSVRRDAELLIGLVPALQALCAPETAAASDVGLTVEHGV